MPPSEIILIFNVVNGTGTEICPSLDFRSPKDMMNQEQKGDKSKFERHRKFSGYGSAIFGATR